jgi:hypothetical protein
MGLAAGGGLPPGTTFGQATGLTQPLPAPGPALPSAPPPGAAPIAPRPSAPAAPNAEAQALAQQGKAFEQQAKDKEAEAPAAQGIEDTKATGLQQRADLRTQQAEEYAQQQKIAQQAHANAVAEAQDAVDEYKNFKFTDLQRSTGSRIVSIVGSFLGGLGGNGGINPMLDKLKRETDRDFEKQKLQLQSKENIAKLKREGVKDVDAYQADQLARLQIKQGMALASIGDHIDAMSATATGKLRAVEGKTAADTIRTEGAKQQFEGQAKLVESKLKTAQTAEAYAQAGKARAEARVAGQKSAPDDDEIFYDKQGNAVGLVAKGRGGAQAFATRDANFQDALGKMNAYKSFLASVGGRPRNLDEIKRARVLYNNAGLAVAAVSPNGTSDTAQEHERASLGPDPSSIMGFAQGGSLEAVDSKIAQVSQLQQDYRTQTLRPLHGRQVGTQSAVPQPGGAAPPPAAAPPVPTAEGAKVVQNGVTFIRRGGQWLPQ